MDKNNAFGVVKDVVSKFVGTLADHQLIQKALHILEVELFGSVDKEPEEQEVPKEVLQDEDIQGN